MWQQRLPTYSFIIVLHLKLSFTVTLQGQPVLTSPRWDQPSSTVCAAPFPAHEFCSPIF
jgi:hypothetical protein